MSPHLPLEEENLKRGDSYSPWTGKRKRGDTYSPWTGKKRAAPLQEEEEEEEEGGEEEDRAGNYNTVIPDQTVGEN